MNVRPIAWDVERFNTPSHAPMGGNTLPGKRSTAAGVERFNTLDSLKCKEWDS